MASAFKVLSVPRCCRSRCLGRCPGGKCCRLRSFSALPLGRRTAAGKGCRMRREWEPEDLLACWTLMDHGRYLAPSDTDPSIRPRGSARPVVGDGQDDAQPDGTASGTEGPAFGRGESTKRTGPSDARPAQSPRDAEQAARAALGDTLIGVAGQLGEAHAHARNLTELIATARHKAEQIRAAANAQARELTDRAEAEAAEAARGYAAAWAAAKDADWAPNQLRAMGYPAPPRSRNSRPRADTSPVGEVPSPAADTAA